MTTFVVRIVVEPEPDRVEEVTLKSVRAENLGDFIRLTAAEEPHLAHIYIHRNREVA